jgi:hypothetical protein
MALRRPERVGGIQPETAVFGNVLSALGLSRPDSGTPYDEALLFGLAGGVGLA